MSLARYCHERCIALSTRDSAYTAAHAMRANHVGAIVVYERGRAVGIVTDRDLALRVVAERVDPDVPLEHVMTEAPATLDVEDDLRDALWLMRDLRVRRVPVVDGDRLVGMVTIDDLLLSRDVSIDAMANIVQAQLAAPSSQKPSGAVHPVRMRRRVAERPLQRHARGEQTLRRFGERLRRELNVGDRALAIEAFEVVAGALIRRLRSADAAHFTAQLPSEIRERLLDLPAGPDRRIDLEEVEGEMARRLHIDRDHAARLVRAVGEVLGDFVSPGALRHLETQLPYHLRALVGTAEPSQPVIH
jgi:uncharacterized protein (DUF2267 family)/predicted transcriptional regulator